MKALALIVTCAISLVPCQASACTCCGEDDEQFVFHFDNYGYRWEVLGQLRLGSGWLNYHETEGWETLGGLRVGDSFVFQSEVGPFKLHLDMERSEHWVSDISFISQPDKQPTDMVDMLHQVIFRGTLQLPPAAATALGQQSVEATLALRGVGSSCLETDTLRRWQISAEMEKGWLNGGGAVQAEVEPAGS